jgi:hypothetical protein
VGNEWVDIQIPRLKAGRMYFSIAKSLDVLVPPNGRPGIDNLPVLGNKNFETLFDFMEFDWQFSSDPKWPGTSVLGFNTTQVDSFSLPFGIELKGLEPSRGEKVVPWSGFKMGMNGKPGVRKKIFDNMKQAPAPWNKLVTDYRVLNPEKGMLITDKDKKFPENQLDDYITRVWDFYKRSALIATVEAGATLIGSVNDQDNLVFTSSDGQNRIAFPKPTTKTVYSSGPLSTENPESRNAGIIRAALQAGFLRSTVRVSNALPACDTSQFYTEDPINWYAKTIHEAASDGFGAYAFGFDDVCSNSSYVGVRDPESVTIHLLNF